MNFTDDLPTELCAECEAPATHRRSIRHASRGYCDTHGLPAFLLYILTDEYSPCTPIQISFIWDQARASYEACADAGEITKMESHFENAYDMLNSPTFDAWITAGIKS